MEEVQSICTRDNGAQVNHQQLLLGNCNILTLTGKEFGAVDLDGRWKLFYSGADLCMSAHTGAARNKKRGGLHIF